MGNKSAWKKFRLSRVGALLIAFSLVATACTSGDGEAQSQVDNSLSNSERQVSATGAFLPRADETIIATVSDELTEIQIFDAPDVVSTVTHTLEHPRFPPNITTAVDTLFTMIPNEQAPEGWIEVNVPVKPNGTTGWIKLSDVTLTSTPFKVIIDRNNFNLKVTEKVLADDGSLSENVVLETAVGIGTGETATPVGEFYITELIASTNEFYGPFAFGLSGFSEDLKEFAGQPNAVIGIHGTNDPSSIGQQSSNGCVRLDNETIVALTDFLPLGTPVQIF